MPARGGSLDSDAFRAALKARGFKQRDLADALGITAAAVSQWVNQQSDPSVRQLRRVCLILHVPPHVLLSLGLRQHVETSWILDDNQQP